MIALHTGSQIELHVVAQIIKAELVVRAVGDVGGVRGLALEIVHVVLDTADRQSEKAINLTHPFRVARREIIVHRDDIHAATSQRVEIGRQRRDQGLAFAGAHLSDLALMQDDAADHLHVEVTHSRSALACFADQGKRFRQDFLQRFLLAILAVVFIARVFDGVGDLRLEESRALAQLFVGKFLNLRLEFID